MINPGIRSIQSKSAACTTLGQILFKKSILKRKEYKLSKPTMTAPMQKMKVFRNARKILRLFPQYRPMFNRKTPLKQYVNQLSNITLIESTKSVEDRNSLANDLGHKAQDDNYDSPEFNGSSGSLARTVRVTEEPYANIICGDTPIAVLQRESWGS